MYQQTTAAPTTLRSGAEQVRTNFLQSSKDQEDLLNINNRQEDTIYQNSKTLKGNSSKKENSFQEGKFDNWVDLDSFSCKKDDLNQSIIDQSLFSSCQKPQQQLQISQVKDDNSHRQMLNLDKSISIIGNERLQDAKEEKNQASFISTSNELFKLNQEVKEDNKHQQNGYSPKKGTNQQKQDSNQNNEQPSLNIQYFGNVEGSLIGLSGVWKRNPLIVITKIKQFIIQMKKNCNALKFQQMNSNLFEYISDISANYKYYHMNNYISTKQSSVSRWQKLWYQVQNKFNLYFQNKLILKLMIQTVQSSVIQPHSITKMLWELFFFISIIWQIFYVPFFISFSRTQDFLNQIEFFQNLLYLQIPVILFTDIIFNFFSAYYSKGKLERRRRKIFQHYVKKGKLIFYRFKSTQFQTLFQQLTIYNKSNFNYFQIELIFLIYQNIIIKQQKQNFIIKLQYLLVYEFNYISFILKGKFFIDLIVAIVFLINIYLRIDWLDYFIFFKIQRLSQIYNNFEEKVNLRYKYSSLIDLSNLAFNILFIAHICGCFFFLIAVIENSHGVHSTWVEFYNLDDKTVAEQYITSIYWAVITMITLGYGDFVPKTMYEKIFTICITLISCGVFAYSVNQIGSIINNMTQQKAQFQQKIAQISGYLQERGIKSELLMKIKKNFAYLQRESVKDMEIHKIISTQLSKSLHTEVLRDIYIKVLQDCKIFKLNFSEQFLQQLAPLLKERKFAPEEVIYEQGTTHLNLYFIIRGQVSLNFNLNGDKKQIKLLQKNDVLGEQSFFSQNQIDHSAISINVANLVYIDIQDFLSVIKNFQSDFETFCMMKDKLNLFSITKMIGMKCYSCGQFQHLIKDCPYINYLPNKEKILINHNLETKQERDPTFSEKRMEFVKNEKTIVFQRHLQEDVVNFLIENNLYDDLHELIQILKNQHINIEESVPVSSTEQKIIDTNFQSALTQKSIQVLYPKMLTDTQTEVYTNSPEEILSPSKLKLISPIRLGSSMMHQQIQQVISPQKNKIKRTQTNQSNKTDSFNFMSSLKQINPSENSHTTQIFDRRDSRKRSNINQSLMNNQMLRESSRKIILEEFECQNIFQQVSTHYIANNNTNNNNNNNNNQFTTQSILFSNISPTINSSVNSSYMNNNNNSIIFNYNLHAKDNLNSNQMTFQQNNMNNSIYAHMNSINNPAQQANQNYQQSDQGNKFKKETPEQNNKMVSSQTSLSQKNKKSTKNLNDQQKHKEKNNEQHKNQLKRASQNFSSNHNPLNYGANSYINNQLLQVWSSFDINNFEKMSYFNVYFPHNNYQISIDNYNSYLKRNVEINNLDNSQRKIEKIKQLKQSFLVFKGGHRAQASNSQRNSRVRVKSQYYLNNKNAV